MNDNDKINDNAEESEENIENKEETEIDGENEENQEKQEDEVENVSEDDEMTEKIEHEDENEIEHDIFAEDNADTDEPDSEALETPEIELTQEMLDAEYFAPTDVKKRVAEEMFDWIEIFSSALLTVILLFTFLFRLVTVQGPSMEYTLHGGEAPYGDKTSDNLIISNLFYTPKQGDIVVIQVPNPSFPTPIIKRVIAVEGQTVDFDFEKWIVYVDGEPIYEVGGFPAIEPYVNYESGRYMNNGDIIMDELPITVEPGKIFVMGDNRNHSSDSRASSIGQVDIRNVVGRVLLRVFPINKFGAVNVNEK